MDSYRIGGITRIAWNDLPPRWQRLHRLGSLTIAFWLTFWFATMIGSVITHWGPFGWIATLQIDLLGSDGPIIGALPALAMMGVPGLVVSRMAKTADRPFLFGMQDATDNKRPPRLDRPPGDQRRRLRRRTRAGLAVGLAGLGLLCVGWWRIDRMDAGPPAPLLGLSFSRIASGAVLPATARIEGVSAYPGTRWTHDTTVRQTLYRNVYYPLAPPGWTPAQAVRLIELDRTFPHDAPAPWNEVDAPGPREGKLRPLDDDWLAERLTGAGMRLADHVVILEREQLHGVQPPSGDNPLVFNGMALGGAVVFAAFLLAWASWRALRLLPQPTGEETSR